MTAVLELALETAVAAVMHKSFVIDFLGFGAVDLFDSG